MKAEYINPFLTATANVLKQLTGAEAIRGRTLLKNSPRPTFEIAIFVGITGSQVGQAIYSMNYETAIKISRALSPGTSDADLAHEYRDILGEIANMITGNAVQLFAEGRTGIDLTVPMVADIRQGAPNMPDQPTLGLNMYTPYGLLEVHIAFKAAKPGA